MENKNEDYLYHYTSIENLLLILKNKTIAFNSLQNVDDLEECDSEDIKQVGKVCYVSCWTKDSTESIPMWNMYTPSMQGIRIKLKRNPFKKIYNEEAFQEDKGCWILGGIRLVDVIYTNDTKKLYPKIKGVVKNISEVLEVEEKDSKMKYNICDIGKYKRKNWEFQSETRYIIIIPPISRFDINDSMDEKDIDNLIESRVEDPKVKAPFELFFLELSEEAFDDVEILLAPKVNEAQEEIVRLIVKEFCPKAKISKSELKIR